jgi:Na+/melibiose symporter-like transporter
MTHATPSPSRLLWPQTWGLALIQGAIVLLWLTYGLFLPKLLIQAGLSAEMAAGILIVERGLSAIVEPIVGLVSDRQRHNLAGRMPFVTIGVGLTALISLGLPAVAAWPGVGRLLLPGLLVLWALAMSLFRVPMMALLGGYASRTQLPYAAGLLTLVGGITGVLGPWLKPRLTELGAPIGFALASGVLLLAAAALTWAGPTDVVAQPADADQAPADGKLTSPIGLLLLVMTGAAATIGSGLLFGGLVPLLSAIAVEPPLFFSVLAITTTAMALPAGRYLSLWGIDRLLPLSWLGLAAMTALSGLGLTSVGSIGMAVAIAVLIGSFLSVASTAVFPLTLRLAPVGSLGLGMGAYVSGAGLASTILTILGPKAAELGLVRSAIGFSLAAGLVILGCRMIPDPPVAPPTSQPTSQPESEPDPQV